MLKSTLTIGWVKQFPRVAADKQLAALLAYGVDPSRIIMDGRKDTRRERETWDTLGAMMRAGDTLAVSRLRVIYGPKGKETPRRALFRAIHQVEDAGCKIVEIATGRRSWNARERDMMIRDALDDIARSRRGEDGGRPRLEWSAEEKRIVKVHWHSHQHPTNAAAFKAIKADARAAGLTWLASLRHLQSIQNVFGASGRGAIRRKSAKK